jgi:hypothetical protein
MSESGDIPVWCSEHMEPYCPRHAKPQAESDYIEALVSERVRRHNAVIEQACEASLLSAEHGVRVEWDGDTTRAWVDPEGTGDD